MSQNTFEVSYDADMGSHKIVIPLVRPDGHSINLTMPIIIDNEVPESHVFYDYYNTGALYVNLPSDTHLSMSKDTLSLILNKYIYGDPQFASFDLSDVDKVQVFNSKYSWTKIYFHPTRENSFGFLFSLDLIFETKKTNTQVPICKNMTISETGKENVQVISKKYAYANIINDKLICSHETLSTDSFTTCPFGLNNQKKCSFYESSEVVIKYARSYDPSTSSIKSHFSLTYFNSYTHHVFVIKNEITNSEVTRLAFPIDGEYTYDSLLEESVKIFDQTISVYPNMVFSNPDISPSFDFFESASYISHLIDDKVQVG